MQALCLLPTAGLCTLLPLWDTSTRQAESPNQVTRYTQAPSAARGHSSTNPELAHDYALKHTVTLGLWPILPYKQDSSYSCPTGVPTGLCLLPTPLCAGPQALHSTYHAWDSHSGLLRFSSLGTLEGLLCSNLQTKVPATLDPFYPQRNSSPR